LDFEKREQKRDPKSWPSTKYQVPRSRNRSWSRIRSSTRTPDIPRTRDLAPFLSYSVVESSSHVTSFILQHNERGKFCDFAAHGSGKCHPVRRMRLYEYTWKIPGIPVKSDELINAKQRVLLVKLLTAGL